MQYFCDHFSLLDTQTSLFNEESHHLQKVKRAQIKDVVQIFNGQGLVAKGEIIAMNKKETTLLLSEKKQHERFPPYLRLFIVCPKGKNFSFILEKATELGVHEIHPIESERSVKVFKSERSEKYEKQLLEACKQCERPFLPKLFEVKSFVSALENDTEKNIRILLHPRQGVNPLELESHEVENIDIFVGPEGGWSDEEIVFARDKNVQVCTLPVPVLRVETAVMASLAIFSCFHQKR